MRSDLGTIEGLSGISVDVDQQTCQFRAPASLDVEQMLETLAEGNNKFADWNRQTGDAEKPPAGTGDDR